jgi:hypothetical protein
MLNYIEKRQAKAEAARRIAVMGGRRGEKPRQEKSPDYSKLKKAELADLLTAKGVFVSDGWNKAELLSRLKGGDN